MSSEAQRRAARKYSQTTHGRQKLRGAMHRYRLRLRIEILKRYGDGKLACVKCGEDNMLCLTVDHIDGGGTKHKREIGGAVKFYPLLKKQGYPDGYQTLCMNCQWKKKGSPSNRYNK